MWKRFFSYPLKSLFKGETIFSSLSPQKSRAAEKIVSPLKRDRIRWQRKNLFRILGETSNNRRKSRAAWEVFSMHYASERTARKKFSVVWDFSQYLF